MLRLAPPITAALMLSGCTTVQPEAKPTVGFVEVATGWHAEISPEDEQRIEHLPDSWRTALASVEPRNQRLVTREGDLLIADAARDRPAPPPGSYRCRLVKLGPGTRRELPVRSFPAFFCYIRAEANGGLSFTKQTGTDLPGGWLHEDGLKRMILIGARQQVAGSNSVAYGTDPARDVVGVLERIGPFRWRLVLPWRAEPAGMDVYELTPVPPDQQVAEPRVSPSEAPTP